MLRNERYNAWLKKIRPVSYGTAYKESFDASLAAEKKYDVFFSGGTHYSPVRQDGVRILEKMQAEGLRVCLPKKVPHAEFLRLCSESWLVLSPEGAEWQSARHYESLLMKSVPLINYPNVRLQEPLRDGEHVIYYPPEGICSRARSAARWRTSRGCSRWRRPGGASCCSIMSMSALWNI